MSFINMFSTDLIPIPTNGITIARITELPNGITMVAMHDDRIGIHEPYNTDSLVGLAVGQVFPGFMFDPYCEKQTTACHLERNLVRAKSSPDRFEPVWE